MEKEEEEETPHPLPYPCTRVGGEEEELCLSRWIRIFVTRERYAEGKERKRGKRRYESEEDEERR